MDEKMFNERFLSFGFTEEQIEAIFERGKALMEEDDDSSEDFDYEARGMILEEMFDSMIDASDDERKEYLMELTGFEIDDDVISKMIGLMEVEW